MGVVKEIEDTQETLALMMEEAVISETSVNLYLTTWSHIPEDIHLHICRHENF
jgi:hypothetical protein